MPATHKIQEMFLRCLSTRPPTSSDPTLLLCPRTKTTTPTQSAIKIKSFFRILSYTHYYTKLYASCRRRLDMAGFRANFFCRSWAEWWSKSRTNMSFCVANCSRTYRLAEGNTVMGYNDFCSINCSKLPCFGYLQPKSSIPMQSAYFMALLVNLVLVTTQALCFVASNFLWAAATSRNLAYEYIATLTSVFKPRRLWYFSSIMWCTPSFSAKISISCETQWPFIIVPTVVL